jgi:hypothetical protein
MLSIAAAASCQRKTKYKLRLAVEYFLCYLNTYPAAKQPGKGHFYTAAPCVHD